MRVLLLGVVACAACVPAPVAPNAARDNPVSITITDWHPPEVTIGAIAPAPPRGLPAPHRTTAPYADPRTPDEVRALVGRRDKRPPRTVALAWARALGGVAIGEELPDLARRTIGAADAVPGDLVVFDRAVTGEPADLVAVVLARDAHAVLEIAFLAGGVVRRGWLDAAHPTRHRDDRGRTINSILRFGDRWPPAGTHYLAGELLAAIVH